MIQVSLNRLRVFIVAGVLFIVVVGAAVFAGGTATAPTPTLSKLGLKELVEKADQICVAKCLDRDTTYSNDRIVTRYKMKPSEVWKGDARLSSDGVFELEEQGGQLDGKVPIGQYVPGMADIIPEEEVLLFTKNPARGVQASAASRPAEPVSDSPIIVGRWQGRFTVFAHPATQERLVGQATVSTVPGSSQNRKTQATMIALNKAAQPAPPSTDARTAAALTPQARLALMGYDPAKQKALAGAIDKAATDARNERAARALKAPEAADDIIQYESLSDVKLRVMRQLKRAKK